jgi:hypothetical protein
MSREKTLGNEIKSVLPKGSFFNKIENRVGVGLPDLFILLNGIPLFIELKSPIKGNKLREPLTSSLFLFDGGIVAECIAKNCDFPKSATLASRKTILETLYIATSCQSATLSSQITNKKR